MAGPGGSTSGSGGLKRRRFRPGSESGRRARADGRKNPGKREEKRFFCEVILTGCACVRVRACVGVTGLAGGTEEFYNGTKSIFRQAAKIFKPAFSAQISIETH